MVGKLAKTPHIRRHVVRFTTLDLWRHRPTHIERLLHGVILLELDGEVEVANLHVKLLLFRFDFDGLDAQIAMHYVLRVQLG